MKKDNVINIRKIIEYCEIIDELLEEYQRDYAVFQTSKSFQLSTTMCLIQIGEYVSRIDDEYRKKYDFIPWRKIKGMRDLAAHQYDKFDYKILWYTITVEIPELKESLKTII